MRFYKIAPLAFAAAFVTTLPAAAETFEVEAVIICPASLPDCGLDPSQLDEGFRQSLAALNLQWRATPYSFRPLPIRIVNDDYLASLDAASGFNGSNIPNSDVVNHLLLFEAGPPAHHLLPRPA
jgi:hypothetical protein